jgi:hypothetical protein
METLIQDEEFAMSLCRKMDNSRIGYNDIHFCGGTSGY